MSTWRAVERQWAGPPRAAEPATSSQAAALRATPPRPPPAADAGAEAPAADPEAALRALLARGVAAPDSLRAFALPLFAADTLAALHRQLEREQYSRHEAQAALEAERTRERGIVATLRRLADDFGLGLGWTGLYFTAFLALGRGQTPGKRLLRIRVVRLDGSPMSWWCAFERFGGYAASLATGLLGFLQIFWDANRQGIHDKAVHTVVVHERRAS
jgi:hypothetical protein